MYINNKKVNNIFIGAQSVAKLVANGLTLFATATLPPVETNVITGKFKGNNGKVRLVGSSSRLTTDGVDIYVDDVLIPFPADGMYATTDANVHTVKYKFKHELTNCENYFYLCDTITELDFSNIDTSNVTNMFWMFDSCYSLTSIQLLDTSSVTNMQGMFNHCSSLTSMSIPLLDTSSVTNMRDMFGGCTSLKTIPLLDTSSVTNMQGMFDGCTSLKTIPLLDTHSVTNMGSMFWNCTSLKTIPLLDTHSVTYIGSMFYGCSSLTSIPLLDTSSVTNMQRMFLSCSSLTKVIFTGGVDKVTDANDMFKFVDTTGEFIYDYRYDHKKVIDELPDKWVAKTSLDVKECTSLSITADDCYAKDTTTTIHVTAIVNGVNIATGEEFNGFEYKFDAISDKFDMNPSWNTSRQITVSYTYFGQTATTTITQDHRYEGTATVDLKGNWTLAPSDTIPNPDPNLYVGVYLSVHKGQGNVHDTMTITFSGMPNFELYIRSYAESSYDYVYCGKLDLNNPTESDNQATTKGKQNSGTDLASYIKVDYPNDGGQHSITVVYRKDSSGDRGDDRGYVFFTKPDEKPNNVA